VASAKGILREVKQLTEQIRLFSKGLNSQKVGVGKIARPCEIEKSQTFVAERRDNQILS
jgi:hypothetical protein